MQQGELWTVSLPQSGGREQVGERPALVVQNALYGQGSPLVLIVPLTSQLSALRFPATVQIAPSTKNGLPQLSVAMGFQTRALDRGRFRQRIGTLSDSDLLTVIRELEQLIQS